MENLDNEDVKDGEGGNEVEFGGLGGEGGEDLDEILFGSSVNLIPQLIDLYEEVSMVESITEFISGQISRFRPSSFKTFLMNLLSQWEELIELGKVDKEIKTERINNSKSVILALIFGSFFTQALDIIAHKGVGIVEGLTVVTETSYDYKIDKKMEEELIESDINELLSVFDLTINQGQIVPLNKDLQISKANVPGDIGHRSYFVQLDNWYCSCEGYQTCYTKSWLDSSQPLQQSLNYKIDELKFISFDQIDPMPMCSHLMATLLVRLNNLQLHEISHLPSQIP